MATQIVKKVSAPYLLFAANAQPTLFTVGKSTTNNAEVVINGNLNVLGTTTTISSTDTEIFDRIITLGAGIAPTDPPSIFPSGISVDRGAGDAGQPGGFSGNASLIWSEVADAWQLTNDGGATFKNIATAGASGSYLTDIVEDLSPQLGGDLDINGYTITSAADNVIIAPSEHVQINSAVQLQQLTVIPPAPVTGFSLLYAGPENGGGTGLYSTVSVADTNEELISKKKAILYSLIF